MVSETLATVFVARLDRAPDPELDPRELATKLSAFLARAREAWPGLEQDDSEFIAHAAALASGHQEPLRWLEQARPEDLWLAFACCRGSEVAITTFEREFAEDLRRAVGRFGKTPDQREDLMQTLRTKLFVGTPERGPKVSTYAGIGYLQNWLRVTATRTFVDLTRAKKTPEANTPLDVALASGGDAELDFLKQRYRAAFKTAFAEATAALEPAERNLLRRRLQGLGVDQLAALEGVHRSTAARRLAKARHSLLHHTRTKLSGQLAVDASELDSVMGLFQSRLDLSLERLLESRDEKDG